MIEFKELVGKNVKLLRTALGMTGEEFSKYLGISRNHLFLLEHGKATSLRLSAIHKLRREVDLTEFFQR